MLQRLETLFRRRRWVFLGAARPHRVHDAYGECADAAIAIPAGCVIEHHVILGKQLLQRSWT